MDRFIRTRALLGEERFRQLQRRAVTVVGLGAVGGYVVEGLVRAGITRLRLVDFDTIQPSNLNRQILALESTLGRPKAEVARERVLAINPHCRVEALQLFAGDETIEHILAPPPDLLVDAIDSLNPKTQLLHAAWLRNIPTISSMGAALRTDPALIRCGDLFATSGCPLARHLRKRLRRRGVTGGIYTVYSTEEVDFRYEPAEPETAHDSSPYADRGRSRHILGSLPTITAIFGMIIANHALLQLAKPQAETDDPPLCRH
jgi:tRNA threonylcarbamoyladenosine dehydratase